MRSGYSHVHQSSERARQYDEMFSKGYDGAVWSEIEKSLIAEELKPYLGGSARLADLACGTGRVLEVSSGIMSAVTGFDVSAEMLAVSYTHLTLPTICSV